MELEQLLGQFAPEAPELGAGHGVERDDLVHRRGNEHDAIVDERRFPMFGAKRSCRIIGR
jgi:hypothetical protein